MALLCLNWLDCSLSSSWKPIFYILWQTWWALTVSFSPHPSFLTTLIFHNTQLLDHFSNILNLYNLTQNVNLPTHIHKNILNLLISFFPLHTLSFDNLSTAISDHLFMDICFLLHFHFSPPPFCGFFICYRHLASINTKQSLPTSSFYCLNTPISQFSRYLLPHNHPSS